MTNYEFDCENFRLVLLNNFKLREKNDWIFTQNFSENDIQIESEKKIYQEVHSIMVSNGCNNDVKGAELKIIYWK